MATEAAPLVRRRPRSWHGAAMGIDEFLDLPDDGADRWLLDGIVHEWLPATRERMTVRTIEHGQPEGAVVTALRNWLKQSRYPAKAASGEIGVRLRPGDATLVGTDVVLWRDGTPLERRGKRGNVIAGVPLLVVEVLSDSDRMAAVLQKVATYVEAGVPLVLAVDPFQKAINAYRGTMRPETLLLGDTLDGGAELPGFSVTVAEVFE